MSIRGAVAGCVVLVGLVAFLVEKTEGHITFFSPREMMLMKVSSLCLIGLCVKVNLAGRLRISVFLMKSHRFLVCTI